MNSLHTKAINSIKSREASRKASVSGDLTVNFHPDRLTKDGRPLLSAIALDGILKSQYETGTSNGGLTAFVGGDRYDWEQRVFDGIYDESLAHQRPKYGGFNYLNQGFGASPRFGSSYFLLKPEISERTTYCYPDSFFLPEDFASHQGLMHLVELAKSDSQDLLDNYIEAQFHGEISVQNDVEALVLDPIYKNTDIEKQANALGIEVRFHSGFRLQVSA
ncbi:hypothetical protein JCM19241_5513 [Vibrio ishigakensis]|uniref:DUF3626 domain-containing protein n=1 Tax=Vibrio ishigakensis TaxID=1481914 RepID=A0A0B8QBL8_9VIBR|nr:hypothetical protein JCM19241_5513 [Vibrio ishigakensis]